MQQCAIAQQYLSPLASAFCLPSEDIACLQRVDFVLERGEEAVTTLFPHVREALAIGTDAYEPLEMQTLQGVIGTGITLLDAVVETAEEKGIDSTRRAKLQALLEEYQKLFEDIELFSTDILAEDCLLAASQGILRQEFESGEENAVWRDL